MIIQCPACSTRFNVPDEKIAGPTVRLRCSKCAKVFPAGEGFPQGVPGATPPSAASSTPPAPASTPPSPAPSTPPSPAPGPAPQRTPSAQTPIESLRKIASGQFPRVPTPHGRDAGSLPGGFALPGDPAPAPPRTPTSAPPPPGGGPLGDDPFGAPGPDPFGGPADNPLGAPGPSPFAGEPPPDPFAAPGTDPFGDPVGGQGAPGDSPFDGPAPSMPPQPAAPAPPSSKDVAPGADPFAAAAPPGPDPFSGAAASAPFGGPPSDPFSTPGTAGPFAASGGGSFDAGAAAAQDQIADELFGGGGAGPPEPPPDDDPSDPFAVAEQSAQPPPPPEATDPFSAAAWSDEAGGAPVSDPFADAQGAPTEVHPVSDELRDKARPAPRPKRRGLPLTSRPGFVKAVRAAGRAVAGLLHAALLLGFLLAAVVWARGGSIDDVADGRVVDVILRGPGATAQEAGDLSAVEVVVTRRPLPADPGLVVVSGLVENRGKSPVRGIRVDVRFGPGGEVYSAWAGRELDALDLSLAPDRETLVEVATRPATANLLPGERAPFAVLASGVPDGVRAEVKVELAEVPSREPRPPSAGG